MTYTVRKAGPKGWEIFNATQGKLFGYEPTREFAIALARILAGPGGTVSTKEGVV